MKSNKFNAMLEESFRKTLNGFAPTGIFVDEGIPGGDFSSVAIMEGNTITDVKTIDGPISEDDLIKAMEKLKETDLLKKGAFIIVEDFYEDFSKMLMGPVTTTTQKKGPTTLFGSPVYKQDSKGLLTFAETLIRDNNFDEIYIITRKEVYVVDKKFFDSPYYGLQFPKQNFNYGQLIKHGKS